MSEIWKALYAQIVRTRESDCVCANIQSQLLWCNDTRPSWRNHSSEPTILRDNGTIPFRNHRCEVINIAFARIPRERDNQSRAFARWKNLILSFARSVFLGKRKDDVNYSYRGGNLSAGWDRRKTRQTNVILHIIDCEGLKCEVPLPKIFERRRSNLDLGEQETLGNNCIYPSRDNHQSLH
jgi:hypothetical protein